ncbi:hypothetical protein PV08_07664 [Exophiala spinifera]|uniref:RING-type E3 ubiquitin transferase n=1 Tax=Exophiala spinifera TaxID=91928 RepID=A0A0D2BUD3_9EURO|nr:uncharacterized protein PV08_07664 [Exophiala spinifera]KIW14879.1 hypothetical protein PV08_07664 [Exophiala spinifera]
MPPNTPEAESFSIPVHPQHVPYEEGQDHCRICRGEATPSQPLFYPCKCSGSIRFVHQECLMEWLAHSQKKYCELCKTSFRFTKLYDRSMPAALPFPLFIRQLARHGARTALRYTRYLIVGLIWICCLPWCIRQIWRGMIWFADGNWLDEDHTQSMLNNTATAASNGSSYNVTATSALNEYLEQIKLPLPPMQLSLADIVRVFLSQGLIARVAQLFLSLFLPGWKRRGASAAAAPTTQPVRAPRRPPSLLSDVEFLSHLTNVPTINAICIDVVEGQLICVSLVTAFILVFLIREWVINQQPNLNMPDPDLVDAVPEPQQQNQPQELNDQVRPEQNAEVLVPEQGQRPIIIPRLRHVLTEDNIVTDTGDVLERPNVPNRSQSLIHDGSAQPDRDVAGGESSASVDDTEPGPFRRHSLSNSILIQRNFEVVSGNNAGQGERFPIPFEYSHSSNDEEFFNTRPLSDIEDHHVGTSSPLAQHTAPSDMIDLPEDDMDSDGLILPTPESSDTEQPSRAVEVTTSDNHDSSNGSTGADRPEDHNLSIWQRLARWLWPTENFENIQIYLQAQVDGANNDEDDEQIMQDALAEAPFVPNNHNHNHMDLPPQPAPVLGPAAPAAREPNIVLGVDLNDPNAAEDIEDLDGVLELLGMEGPIFGMVQNVIFSLFLITITLSASVWCPYVWGKIALLFMHNPIMLIKAPLLGISTTADMIVDCFFFVAGLGGYFMNQPLKVLKALISPLFPAFGGVVDSARLDVLTLDISQKSGARLEKALSGAFLNLKPDLPTFSIMAHHALLSYKASIYYGAEQLASSLLWVQHAVSRPSFSSKVLVGALFQALRSVPQLLQKTPQAITDTLNALRYVPQDLLNISPKPPLEVDPSLVTWSTEDRIITILIGYAFFAAVGIAFLELAHVFLGLRDNEKVEGYLADSLRQAGGVMKVVVIIGLEMLLFPLYCGLLLDVALLPLFADATIAGRIAFLAQAPFTGVFVHWFIGTCYMFHFALFVSICRKIMRNGVLYFIRDPDDPTFHPVRDVLERPVPAQLGKIAFSALVYGALVIVCLGGVVWSLKWVPGILPIQWATPEPRLAFPVDIVFYNFLLRYILRKVEPSKKISAMYEWWFRGCARNLRLTNFLFGEEAKEETYRTPGWFSVLLSGNDPESNNTQDGTYVRAPASDSVRMPKGRSVFLPVNEQNERVDGQPDQDFGDHGKKDPRFTKVYLPPKFGARISTFIFLLWLFAATTGVAFTIGPLLVGREVLYLLTQSSQPPNDLYAFTTGLQIYTALGSAIVYARPAWTYIKGKIPQSSGSQILAMVKHALGIGYLLTFTLFVLPFVLSLIWELYVHVPLLTYVEWAHKEQPSIERPKLDKHSATIYILQSWVMGLLYLRLLYQILQHYLGPGSRVCTAMAAIVRNGMFQPDVNLASRSFVLPASALCVALLTGPLAVAKTVNILGRIQDHEVQRLVYRFAYPCGFGMALIWLGWLGLKAQITSWRARIRDEVYLIGERLHNFHEPKPSQAVEGKAKVKNL